MRYTFETYNKPLWIVDQMIYTVPIWMAVRLNVPIVVYGENVSVTRGLKDNEDVPSAWNQIYNTVVSDIPLSEVAEACKIDLKDLAMAFAPTYIAKSITAPIYTSYYVRWDAFQNFIFAKTRGFKSLGDDWRRWGGFMDYWQIDSYGYMMAFYSKWCNLGHSGFTDCVCELIRAGHIEKDFGLGKVAEYEGEMNYLARKDFCKVLGYREDEVHYITQKFILRRKNRAPD